MALIKHQRRFNILTNIKVTRKICQRLLKCCHFGEISPNLVKLATSVSNPSHGKRGGSSHRQLLLNIYFLLTVCRKDENKEKEAGNDSLKNLY